MINFISEAKAFLLLNNPMLFITIDAISIFDPIETSKILYLRLHPFFQIRVVIKKRMLEVVVGWGIKII